MKIALIHTEFRLSHLEKVMAEMEQLGPPVIRAVWREDLGMWAALEGCHRVRAALKLGLVPEIQGIDYTPGMTWNDAGMGQACIKYAITMDQVVRDCGKEYVVGFGKDRLPLAHEVRRPEPGEIMKYRIIKPINFDFGGKVVGGLGTVFDSENTGGKDVTDYVTSGFLEIVEDKPKKITKEVIAAPVTKLAKARRRRGK